MNGRIYDPTLGRFMSADPIVQASDNLQSYNRYAYVMNSPFMYTDPSGFSWWTRFRDKVLKPVIAIAAAYFIGPIAAEWLGAISIGGTTVTAIVGEKIVLGVAGGFVGGFVGSGGDLRSGLTGAVTGGLFGWAGTVGGADSLGRYAAHALAGCAGGELSGSGCARGAASAVLGKYATNSTDGSFIASAVAGGAISAVTGGSFASGATTAAYGYLFNELASQTTNAQRGYPTNWWEKSQWDMDRLLGPSSITADGCIRTEGPSICFGPAAIKGVGAIAGAVSQGARIEAQTLAEQLSLKEAQAGAGERIMQGKINDPKFPSDEWAKMQHIHTTPEGQNIVIHYWERLGDALRTGFKFKD